MDSERDNLKEFKKHLDLNWIIVWWSICSLRDHLKMILHISKWCISAFRSRWEKLSLLRQL